MIAALLHGKVSRTLLQHEDVLTAAVFGLLSYVPWDHGFGPWFSRARRLDGETLTPSEAATLRFWPTLSQADGQTVEPDVLFEGASALLVECKLWSGPSGLPSSDEDETVRGQLGRQWLALRHRALDRPAVILYVTPDSTMPTALLDGMVREVTAKMGAEGLREGLYWLSWRSLDRVLGEAGDSSEERVLADLRALLARYGFVGFAGVSAPAAPTITWTFARGSR